MTIATVSKVVKMALLCTGLFSANAAWSSCPESGGQANATHPDRAQAQTLSAATHDQSGTMSATRLYAYFHDPKMNKPDGLGDYVEDYRSAYPQ
jgi:hypothetical protein